MVIGFDDVDLGLLARELGRLPESPKILAVSTRDPSTAEEATLLRSGVQGVLASTANRDTVLTYVRCILSGRVLATPSAMQLLPQSEGQDESIELTLRQSQIMHLLGKGATTAEIAQSLNVSAATVTTHIRRLGNRFNVEGKRQLERIARGSESPNLPELLRHGAPLATPR